MLPTVQLQLGLRHMDRSAEGARRPPASGVGQDQPVRVQQDQGRSYCIEYVKIGTVSVTWVLQRGQKPTWPPEKFGKLVLEQLPVESLVKLSAASQAGDTGNILGYKFSEIDGLIALGRGLNPTDAERVFPSRDQFRPGRRISRQIHVRI